VEKLSSSSKASSPGDMSSVFIAQHTTFQHGTAERCYGLASVGNKEPRSRSLTPSRSPLGWGRESEGKGKTRGMW